MTPSDFTRYPTGNLCNANPAVRPLCSKLKPLIPGRRVAGPARTARVTPGQNAAIHRAVYHAQPGDMLVVDGGGSDRFGPFGDLLADSCKHKDMAGGVFDCTIRDKSDIAALGFQVFARGFHPEPTVKTEAGETDIPVTVGGAVVNPGDVVVGDDDGVVVIPAGLAAIVLEQVADVAAREETVRARIRAGDSTCEIFGIAPGQPRPDNDEGQP